MYEPPQTMDYPTYRHPPTFGTMLLIAALPLVMVFAASFPAATAGLLVGVVAGAALQR
ncbi:hypothetical protein B4589_007315 [Halolamina sp. CBA1230]|uniref:hypothetical protein n=1 Tax=Halolamina sp. CBA1230 TaxID=1853690 RepID=UPI001301F2E6|nr:hypothetical protein [Halolamina sp. CBA1230]QKY20197.1 hypothetical protein B4589_007315 [Halolamina sp. CBA1230]